MAGKQKITVAYGDGIGPEIMQVTLDVLIAAGANLEFDVIEIGEKVYRKDPIRYLRDRVWEDEIIVTEKKIDLDDLYPFDKTGNSRLGRCSNCGKTTFGNKYTIHKDDSYCCNAKINKYR